VKAALRGGFCFLLVQAFVEILEDKVLLAEFVSGLRPSLYVLSQGLSSRFEIIAINSAVGLWSTVLATSGKKTQPGEAVALKQRLEHVEGVGE